ncbi:hypothetical protein IB233_02075 [Comamonas sp. CMM01]|uniref:hypothetical protein n=1 Tax=Comamonas sp. CMM01 TaxID=2769280 RepID=UPI0017803147|nr:hypothetical protein [Comamonas sp. CMM01]MBD9530419.1 hypothetical protein [Comamonas sp. CMM01]
MTQAQQPEALRLADNLEGNRCHRAAAMLRTQHARIAELEAAPAAQEVEPVEVELPDVEDMAHSALEEALSGGVGHDVFHRWMRAVMDKTVAALRAAPAPAAVAVPAKVVEALEMLENGALNVAENAKNRGDGYDEGYANAMAKMARETLDALAATPPAHAQGNCQRCNGSGEDPEGYIDQSRGPDGGTHEGPCRACDGTGAAPQAQDVQLLAADHTGMRVDYSGLLGQVRHEISRSAPGHAEMLRQLQGHIQEVGRRWYAGEIAAVDEFLQLYCVEREARAAIAASAAQGEA